jgi:NADPH:quinone reductase
MSGAIQTIYERAVISAMRAIIYERHGGPDVLTLVDKSCAEPGLGEVRVRVARSGVNPTDWKSRLHGTGIPAHAPQVPNHDGAGIVEAVGAGIDADLVGSRVWLVDAAYQRPEGTAQEYAIVPAGQAVVLPSSASYDLGASLGVPFLTAHRCLTVNDEGPARLGPGELRERTVLVAGGAGAVGNAAIQLARWSDATVIATVSSTAKAKLALAAGADEVVVYTRQDVVEEVRRIAPNGIDTIVEVAPAVNAGIDTSVVAPHGCVSCYVSEPEEEVRLGGRRLTTLNARWQYVSIFTIPAAAKRRAIDDVTTALAGQSIGVGESRGLRLHHFALERAAQAHEAVRQSIVGKVLIDVAEL